MTTTTDTREAARARLLELFQGGTESWGEASRPSPTIVRSQATIWALTRYQSRTRTTSIVDFLVIRHDRPVSITDDMSMVLLDLTRATVRSAHRFSIPPGELYAGFVLNGKERPEDIVNRLSMALFGRYCLDIEVL